MGFEAAEEFGDDAELEVFDDVRFMPESDAQCLLLDPSFRADDYNL